LIYKSHGYVKSLIEKSWIVLEYGSKGLHLDPLHINSIGMELYSITKAFSALSQETRLRIISLLVASDNGALSAGEISDALGIPQNTLSFHLSHLENADLLRRERRGRYIIYSCHNDGMKDLFKYMLSHCIRQD